MKLFQITDTATGKPVEGLYFTHKATAKLKRQELNGGIEAESSGNLKYVVSPGPDHHHYTKPTNARR